MPFIDLESIKSKELFPGFHVRLVHSDTMTFVHWNIQAGSILPQHSHVHEYVAHVLEGEFELMIDGKCAVLKPSTMGVIPANAVHS